MSLTHISKIIYLTYFTCHPDRNIDQISFPNLADSISSFQNSPATVSTQTENFISQAKAKLAHAIAHPDLKTLEALTKINQKRLAQGKKPLAFQKITQDIEAITNQTNLSNKEKKEQIENIRKQLGLSKGEMKNLFTGRLTKLYKQSAKSLNDYEKNKQNQLKEELRQAENTFGKGSPQAQKIQQKITILHNTLEPQKQQWQEHASFYQSLYPSFWSKLGGVLKKIGGGFLKVLDFAKPLLSFIPVVGPIASLAIRGVEALVKAIKTKGKSLINAGLDFIKNKIPPLPEIIFKRDTKY